MSGYSSLSAILQDRHLCDFLLSSLHVNSLLKRGVLLKEKNFLPGSNFFSFRVETFSEGRQYMLAVLTSLRVYPFHLIMCLFGKKQL